MAMTPKAHFVIYSLVTLILFFVKKLLSICYKSHTMLSPIDAQVSKIIPIRRDGWSSVEKSID